MQTGRTVSHSGWRSSSGYLVAVAVTVIVVLVRLGLSSSLGMEAPLLPLLIAITIAAWHGGLKPGLLATGLSALAGVYLFLEPVNTFRIIQASDQVRIALFLFEGVLISYVCEALHRAHSRAEASRWDAFLKQQALEKEVADRKQTEEGLRQAEERVRSIVDHAVDAIISIDSAGVIESFNPAAERLWGYAALEVIGQNVRILMPEPFRGGHDGYLTHYLQTGEAKIIGIGREVVGRRKDGSVFPMDLGVSEYRVGASRHFSGVVRDITERKQAEEALTAADRRKDEFLATLSHELRNPLAPIRNAVQIQNSGAVSAADLAWTRAVLDRQVRHLTRLVDDLLDSSRIRAGKLLIRRERASLSTIIDSAVETSHPLVEAAGHQLSVSLPTEPIHLEADPVRLSQVLSNLLNNAARYMKRGGRISIVAEREGSDVVVSVTDGGIGIEPETLPHVFEVYSQGAISLEEPQSGLGIGLFLAKALVELHGGSLSVHSDGLGHGSRFTVRLPLAVKGESLREDTVLDGASQEAGSKYRLLIVDDLRDAADSLAMLFRIAGHEVQTAYDGEEALATAEAMRPDVMLLDIGMPKANGYEVARQTRAMPWGKGVVLIALTGWGKEEDRRRALEAGFDAHLVKPLSPDLLETTLSGLVLPPVEPSSKA